MIANILSMLVYRMLGITRDIPSKEATFVHKYGDKFYMIHVQEIPEQEEAIA